MSVREQEYVKRISFGYENCSGYGKENFRFENDVSCSDKNRKSVLKRVVFSSVYSDFMS